MPKVLLFHGGGPTAVLNASLAGAISTFQEKGWQVYASPFGIAKLLDHDPVPVPLLGRNETQMLVRSPGSAIGSGRDHLEDQDYVRLAQRLISLGFSAVSGAGGNGTMDTVQKLSKACSRYGITVTGIPKTMDNDLSITDHSPGFLSAALYMAASVREVLYDIHSLPIHVVVIEAFGRNAGWITASSALAGDDDVKGPDLILPPEIPFDEDAFLSGVEEAYSRKGGVCVVASEGLKYGDGKPVVEPVFKTDRSVYFGDVSAKLSQLVTQKLNIKSRSEKPGLLSRASIAWQSRRDAEEAFQCGRISAMAACSGRSGEMSIIIREGEKPYAARVEMKPIGKDILSERTLPASYISREDFCMTDEFFNYMNPLFDAEKPGSFMTFV